MTAIAWDQVGERRYEIGLDRGVLYLPAVAVPWNGLTSVSDTTNQEIKDAYLDGVKYLQRLIPGDYTGSIKAFTYPNEFEACVGVVEHANGLYVHDQNSIPFGLSYRTFLGDDINGIKGRYRLHLLYNLLAVPENTSIITISNSPSPSEFGWSFTSVPEVITGIRPTAHLSLKSTEVSRALMLTIERLLYGSTTLPPYFPTAIELSDIISNWSYFTVVDNEDGTFTITGPEEYIYLFGDESFIITDIEATYLDSSSYQLDTTEPSTLDNSDTWAAIIAARDSGII